MFEIVTLNSYILKRVVPIEDRITFGLENLAANVELNAFNHSEIL
jgi:hypothetical protein